MGIDVNLYAEGAVTDEQLAEANKYFEHRVWIADWKDWAKGGEVEVPALVRDESFDQPRIELRTTSRYYGPGYERGDWPAIYGAIRAMQTAFPGLFVYYGGDVTDDGQECTQEFLEGIWKHWASPEGDAYRHDR